MINIPLGLIQIVLLVIHYGGFAMLPWWLLWLPSLIIVIIVAVWLVVIIFAVLIAWAAGGNIKVDKSFRYR